MVLVDGDLGFCKYEIWFFVGLLCFNGLVYIYECMSSINKI